MFNCDETAAYAAASLAFRDRLITEWNRTQQRQTFADGKRVYYLSLEFLMGRALDNAMLNVGLKEVAKRIPILQPTFLQANTDFFCRGLARSWLPHRGCYQPRA
jgi:glucan phosphorylase